MKGRGYHSRSASEQMCRVRFTREVHYCERSVSIHEQVNSPGETPDGYLYERNGQPFSDRREACGRSLEYSALRFVRSTTVSRCRRRVHGPRPNGRVREALRENCLFLSSTPPILRENRPIPRSSSLPLQGLRPPRSKAKCEAGKQ